MTSIEWLIKELYTEMNMSGDGRVLDEILEEARHKHKQEIIDAWSDGAYGGGQFTTTHETSDEYYQETFVSKGSDDTLKDYHIVDTNEMVDQVPDVRKMVEDDIKEIERLAELNGSPDSSGFYDYKEGFVDGYLEAKETLYTEEQVRKAYYQGATDVHDKCTDRTWRGVETKVDIELLKKLNAEYIQSLKQPKQ